MRLKLNYHHLYYLWAVVKSGGVSEASQQLKLSQPTISAQLRQLEDSLGVSLFEKVGRRLKLTAEGQIAVRYAEEIFSLGEELTTVLSGGVEQRQSELRVGVVDAFPKYVAVRLCRPVLKGPNPPRLIIEEARLEELLARLASHELDMVIADRPMPVGSRIRAFNHLLGECGISFMGSSAHAQELKRGFPQSLNGAPLLLPGADSELRKSLESWFDEIGVVPSVVGEFEDSALMKMFAESGAGIASIPSVVEPQVKRELRLAVVGRTEDVRERFYLISAERKVTHPSVLAIQELARERLFNSER